MLYSLLLSQRFKTANPDNILLYLMREDGFEYLRPHTLELDNLILGRNQLAKYKKLNLQESQ